MTDLNFEGLTEAQLRLFVVRCLGRARKLMKDPRSSEILDVAERHANGEVTDDELYSARLKASKIDTAETTAFTTWNARWSAEWASEWAAAATWAAAGEDKEALEAEKFEQQKILEEIRRNKP